ncbi:ATP-binding cassette domain-containing protein [Breznakiella homolactica]|uniref:ABC-F family ATP-binding cassette domain-containing protein n=1 Tax=Breznakiella homolactica TaxID=2798577 RepID=A0A7T7XMX8_9SPIR|nr:ATP-binding cassette domain-containing protein [Breznakiella homolactica]QQO09248.1 ATP-binding cassette domain-containing protein [Breznakiella homolactica]
MAHNFLSFNSADFYYPSSIHPVLKNIRFDAHPGWTGIVGENGSGKSTLLLLAAGILEPSEGSIQRPEPIVYCPQRTDDLPGSWEDFFYSGDNEAGKFMDLLQIGYDWPYRWESLSHGERKRLQLALALWETPAMLAVDEPTNHLDRDAKILIANALEGYGGIGLLVSHDRTLLDRLCGSCLFLDGGSAVLRPGGVSRGLAEDEREQLEQKRNRQQIVSERNRLAAEADSRRRLAESAKNRMSKRNVDKNDRDTKGKINMARLTGKDAVGTNLYKRMENRIGRLDRDLSAHTVRHERPTGITLTGTTARGDRLFTLPGERITLSPEKFLLIPELTMEPRDRIALTGPNGSGKSTLINRIIASIPGQIPFLVVPQEITMEESRNILEQVLGEEEKNKGEILSRFSRLGSDPRSLLQSALPSPGEIRKLLIARGVFQNPALIIMDEPTNHLDLPSIQLLETTLQESAAALLLVSHDDAFLDRLARKEWALRPVTGGGELVTLDRDGTYN